MMNARVCYVLIILHIPLDPRIILTRLCTPTTSPLHRFCWEVLILMIFWLEGLKLAQGFAFLLNRLLRKLHLLFQVFVFRAELAQMRVRAFFVLLL